jgi:hypothetical protein
MKRCLKTGNVGAPGIAALVAVAAAWGNTVFVSDPKGDNQKNGADISGAKATHGRGHPNVLVHKIFLFTPRGGFSAPGNGGGRVACMFFYKGPNSAPQHDYPTTPFYRRVCYFGAGQAERMQKLRPNGTCCISTQYTPRVTETADSVRWAFPRRALREAVNGYYWRGLTTKVDNGDGYCGDNPTGGSCDDAVPDAHAERHWLPPP